MSLTASRPAQPAPPSWLARIRRYHTWIGLALLVPFLFMALSGIALNHKETFLPKPEKREAVKEKRPAGEKEPDGPDAAGGASAAGEGASARRAEVASLPVGLAEALALAEATLGDAPLERIEIKPEHGQWLYKIRAGRREVIVDAATGQTWAKEGKPPGKASGEEGRGASRDTPAEPNATAKPAEGIDWRKLIKDLHTGKIGGLAGILTVDVVAACLALASLTGLYVWGVARLRKRRSARERAALAQAAARS